MTEQTRSSWVALAMVNDPDGTLYVQTSPERLGDRIGRTNEALIPIQCARAWVRTG